MRTSAAPRDKLTRQFIDFASRVSSYFPELDLRFNLQGGTSRLRYSAPAISDRVFELELGQERIETLIHEAAFSIKELTQRYDA